VVGLAVAIGIAAAFFATAVVRHDRDVTTVALAIVAVLMVTTLVQRVVAPRRRACLESWASAHASLPVGGGATGSIAVSREGRRRLGGTYVIEVDGAPVGVCRSSMVVPVRAGRHSVQVWQSWASSAPLFVDVEPDHTSLVVAGLSASLFTLFRPGHALTTRQE